MPSCVAPPVVKSLTAATPRWIFVTRPRLVVVAFGTRHTLASYLSMHPGPDTTASGEHTVNGPLGGPTAATAAPATSSHPAATATSMHTCLTMPSIGCCA